MEIAKIHSVISNANAFYVGVPDSQIKALCDFLMDSFGISKSHIIAANEGNAVGLAAGYYLATGNIPVVYLQNSGIGNIINPVVSLLSDKVYGIPCIFIIGWRGEPGVKDEPQHIFQGEITLDLLKDIGIDTYIVNKDTSENDILDTIKNFEEKFKLCKSLAFVIRKDSIKYDQKVKYENKNQMTREDILRHIVNISEGDILVSTTGKTSRELFEIREEKKQSHKFDFLTVGSMGHSSSIALGIALQKPDKKIWCIDGDGSALMHMGSMAVIGSTAVDNFIHVVINNNSHESVGGMPTVMRDIDLAKVAEGCRYKYITKVEYENQLIQELKEIRNKNQLSFIEVASSIGSRKNLGRPTQSTYANKQEFMNYLRGERE